MVHCHTHNLLPCCCTSQPASRSHQVQSPRAKAPHRAPVLAPVPVPALAPVLALALALAPVLALAPDTVLVLHRVQALVRAPVPAPVWVLQYKLQLTVATLSFYNKGAHYTSWFTQLWQSDSPGGLTTGGGTRGGGDCLGSLANTSPAFLCFTADPTNSASCTQQQGNGPPALGTPLVVQGSPNQVILCIYVGCIMLHNRDQRNSTTTARMMCTWREKTGVQNMPHTIRRMCTGKETHSTVCNQHATEPF